MPHALLLLCALLLTSTVRAQSSCEETFPARKGCAELQANARELLELLKQRASR